MPSTTYSDDNVKSTGYTIAGHFAQRVSLLAGLASTWGAEGVVVGCGLVSLSAETMRMTAGTSRHLGEWPVPRVRLPGRGTRYLNSPSDLRTGSTLGVQGGTTMGCIDHGVLGDESLVLNICSGSR